MAAYLLRSTARCLVPLSGAGREDVGHDFVVGTASLRGPNEVRVLRYYEEEEDVDCLAAFNHPGEVVSLASCPADGGLLASVGRALPDNKLVLRLYRLGDLSSRPGADDAEPLPDMGLVSEVPLSRGARQACVQWVVPPLDMSGGLDAQLDGEGEDGAVIPVVALDQVKLLAVDNEAARLWTLDAEGRIGATPEVELALGLDGSVLGGAAVDPTGATGLLALAVDASVQLWDLYKKARVGAIEGAVPRGCCVRGVCFNPNQAGYLVTSGDDYAVKAWDVKAAVAAAGGAAGGKSGAVAPLKVLDGHTHWATAVAFNPYHDQLLTSGGGDGRVNLWRLSSISSAPLLELGDDEEETEGGSAEAAGGDGEGSRPARETRVAPDIAVRTHEEHSDTVTSVAWSTYNAWVYSSLSYPGKVAFFQVPSAEKYKILL